MDIQPYRDYNDQLFDLYRKLNLKSIDDFHGASQPEWDGKNFMAWFIDITRGSKWLNDFDESDFKMYDDFVVISGDIKFCAGMLHYLYPSITKAHDSFGSNIIDRRYTMHVGYAFQSIYEFWDRIGDLLWHFFPTGIVRDNIYTSRVLNNLKPSVKESEHYVMLCDLLSQFNEHFSIRNGVVHHFTLGTQLYWERTKAFRDYEANVAIIKKLENFRNIVSQSLPDCLLALSHALRLIKDCGESK